MSDLLERLQAAPVGDRYLVERELGRGGMAVVYLARDRKLDRPVALKVLLPELAASLGGDRFLREIHIAAKLTHPNILSLHDSGEADGLLYYVMPYVEGETLRSRLHRERQLPIDDAVRITLEVADALTHAHSLGIVHRDIKPENILFEADHAVVSDFGIAKAVTAAGQDALTDTGLAVGTPAYMSPEQAMGHAQPDARSDVYSLSCVLYEMLAGDPPYTGSNAQAILARKMVDPVPSLLPVRDTVSAALERVIFRALAKTPADRFSTATAFSDALKRALNEAPEVAPARGRPTPSRATSAAASIAVLPFTNLSPDPENEFFADGITEEIINALGQIRDLRVAARTSAFSFKGRNEDLRTVGEKLLVDTVLEGSVRRAGNHLRITVQLVNVTDGYHLWSERYDRDMDDVFAIQDEIARNVADRLRITLCGETAAAPLVRPPTSDLVAYELYLKGRELLYQRHPAAMRSGIQHFRKALERDPQYALAYAGLAESYGLAGAYQFLPPVEARARAEEALHAGFDVEPDLAQLHFALGQLKIWLRRDWPTAGIDFQRAIESAAPSSLVYGYLAVWNGMLGRTGDLALATERSIDLDPLSPLAYSYPGLGYHSAGAFERAAELYDAGLELDPNFVLGLWGSAYSLLRLGRTEEAIERCERVVTLSQRAATFLGMLGQMYGTVGQREKATALLDELLVRGEHEYVAPVVPLLIYVGLGQENAIREWLARNLAEETGPISLVTTIRPEMDRLRSHQQLGELVNQLPIYAAAESSA